MFCFDESEGGTRVCLQVEMETKHRLSTLGSVVASEVPHCVVAAQISAFVLTTTRSRFVPSLCVS